MLISDPAARFARAAEKRRAVLLFLGAEVWSSADVLGRVAGIEARQAVHRLLTAMEADELVRRAPAPVVRGQGVTLWGITHQGRALTEGLDPLGPVFEPSKLSLTTVPHQLLLQELRLAAEAAGWTAWTRGERLPKDAPVRPDALVTRPDGHVVAVEAERSLKTPKRYQALVSQHLQAMRKGQWVGVYYVAPPAVAGGLARIFGAIDRLPGGIPWDDAGRRRFRLLQVAEWPPSLSQSQQKESADEQRSITPA